jgi:hypothetical protein
MQRLNAFLCGDFIFSPRHVVYWSFNIMIWAAFRIFLMGVPGPYGDHLINIWVPVFILFSYPFVVTIPPLLLKRKSVTVPPAFPGLGFAGLYIESWFLSCVFIPQQRAIGLKHISQESRCPSVYLYMTTFAVRFIPRRLEISLQA